MGFRIRLIKVLFFFVSIILYGSLDLQLSAKAALAVAQSVDGGYRIFRPDGPGPHPAVVFVSGCSGFTPAFAPNAYERPAEQLQGLGFVVVWVDYLGRRGLKSCAGGGVTQEEVGRDVVTAASWLRSQPYVDARRITAMGWSYGGGAVLVALGSHSVDELVFTRAIVYYPYCMDLSPWSHRTPVLVLLAGSDNVAPHYRCKFALEISSAAGDVKIIRYPGALHDFDMSELPPRIEYSFGTIGYHPQAAAAAWDEITRFLQATR